MTRMRLRLLGAAEMEVGGAAEPLRATAPNALLVYLAMAGDWVSRHEAAYLYRADVRDADALRYLRLQLHRLQKLDWTDGLDVTEERLRLRIDSDVARVRRAIDAGDDRAIVATYRGPLLDGFALADKPTFETWRDVERSRLENAYLAALARLGERAERSEDWREAAELATRRLSIDAFDESAIRSLVHALAKQGRRAAALERYEAFARLLGSELGVEPDRATRTLADALRSARSSTAREPDTSATWLPRPATRFVGRVRERSEIGGLLDDPACRLVTIVGLGGSGKTRLALEAARVRASSLRDGARFVAGAEVATTAQFLGRVAAAVDVDLDGGRDPGQALTEALAEREMLLLLDNLEHLERVGEWIAGMLTRAPGVQVLATSRVPLGLTSEWVYDVSGLSLPDERGGAGDAVALFEESARRAAPRRPIGEEERADVARICRRVAGHPLALELAAGWVPAMPVAAIADALDGDVAMLASDHADMPERHRSVTAVLDRSWRDLTEAKREALLRMVPFVGGATLETAATVTGVPPTLWLSLLQQTLLERRVGDRFALHPLVGEHAASRLAERSGLEAEIRDAHADHFIGALARVDGPGSARLLSLDADAADIERAWMRLIERGDLSRAFEVVDAFFERYDVRGAFRAGLQVARDTLARLPSAETATELRASVEGAAATLAWEAGDFDVARLHAEHALALAEASRLARLAARAERRLGDVAQSTGDFDRAAEHYERAAAVFERLRDERGQADVLNSWASMDAVHERHEQAEALFLRCVALFERLGATKDEAIARTNLGFVAEAQGRLEAAARQYEAALAVFERIGFVRGEAAVRNNLIVLYGKQGRWEEAESMGRASLAAKEAIGDDVASVITHKNLGDLALRRGDTERALTHYRPAVRIAHEHGAVPRLLQALVGASEALRAVGQEAVAQQAARAVANHPTVGASLAQRAQELAGVAADEAADLPREPDAELAAAAESALACIEAVLRHR